jgi:hypothetical protein
MGLRDMRLWPTPNQGDGEERPQRLGAFRRIPKSFRQDRHRQNEIRAW